MGRLLAIGDIHGCYDVLIQLIEFVDVDSDDTVVTLGDYCNRGPDTKSVIDWLLSVRESKPIISIRGNHDLLMQQSRDDLETFQRWFRMGGNATLESYGILHQEAEPIASLELIPDEHWEFLDDLLPFYETESHFFVHGNAYPEIALADQPEYMLYWEKFNDPPAHHSGKTMVCGHTSQKSGLPAYNNNAICIDTWAFGNGWLTCLDLGSRQVFQANRALETRKFWLDEN